MTPILAHAQWAHDNYAKHYMATNLQLCIAGVQHRASSASQGLSIPGTQHPRDSASKELSIPGTQHPGGSASP